MEQQVYSPKEKTAQKNKLILISAVMCAVMFLYAFVPAYFYNDSVFSALFDEEIRNDAFIIGMDSILFICCLFYIALPAAMLAAALMSDSRRLFPYAFIFTLCIPFNGIEILLILVAYDNKRTMAAIPLFLGVAIAAMMLNGIFSKTQSTIDSEGNFKQKYYESEEIAQKDRRAYAALICCALMFLGDCIPIGEYEGKEYSVLTILQVDEPEVKLFLLFVLAPIVCAVLLLLLDSRRRSFYVVNYVVIMITAFCFNAFYGLVAGSGEATAIGFFISGAASLTAAVFIGSGIFDERKLKGPKPPRMPAYTYPVPPVQPMQPMQGRQPMQPMQAQAPVGYVQQPAPQPMQQAQKQYKFCGHCGAKLERDMQFCHKCGTKAEA